jgi:signal transduction histidine kinase
LLLDLRPGAVLQSELPDLLRQLAQACRSHLEKPIELQCEGSGRLPGDVHEAFYGMARAALGNVVKHAAGSQARIVLRQQAESAAIVISDDGGGFDARQTARGRRMGLDIMRERALAVGASLVIDSGPGRGTTVSLRWPA